MRLYLFITLMGLALTACGGGGSSSGDSTTQESAVNASSTLQSGLYSFTSGQYLSGINLKNLYSITKVTASNNSLIQEETFYDNSSNSWTTTSPATNVPSNVIIANPLFLSSNGWAKGTDKLSDYSVSYTSNGSAVFTRTLDGVRKNISFYATDVSGKTIASQQGAIATFGTTPFVSTSSTFPTGSVQYVMAYSYATDSYVLWDGSSYGTSLTNIPSTQSSIHFGNSVYAQFRTNSTTVDFVQNLGASPINIGTGSYAFNTVSGQQILEVIAPDNLRTQYQLSGNKIFGTYGGTVYEGTHFPPGVDVNNNGYVFYNKIAIDFLTSNINTTLAKM